MTQPGQTQQAEVVVSPAPPFEEVKVTPKPVFTGPTKYERLNKLYALPVPLRTFPLPTFVPHNPVSLFHVLYTWISQYLKPTPSNFDPLYQGWFSVETRSVHITDSRSIRGLWEQGFYGKGTLSRSEPSWLDREKKRMGGKTKTTSEEVTRKRRAERQQVKWERARKEREVIDQRISEEAEATLVEDNMVESCGKSELHEKINSLGQSGAEANPYAERPAAKVLELSSPTWLDSAEQLVSISKQIEFHSPVGPLELLSLPNSMSSNSLLVEPQTSRGDAELKASPQQDISKIFRAPVGPLDLLALPNSAISPPPIGVTLFESSILHQAYGNEGEGDSTQGTGRNTSSKTGTDILSNGTLSFGNAKTQGLLPIDDLDTSDETMNGSVNSDETINTTVTSTGSITNGVSVTPKIKRQKSVRFSPTVEKNTFIQSEPPSPERAHSGANITLEEPISIGNAEEIKLSSALEEEPLTITDQEHTQLMLEEAFFLSYALGALTILDPTTKSPIPVRDLLTLFRQSSYFPPLSNPSLSPDDPFLINYVVYHHFRSLGWVPRSGVKFSCDFMLYVRGPVFTHAEFAVIILPSYSDPYWSSDVFLQKYVQGKERKTWHWMNCINRVITQVKKTLVLVYVDIPKPLAPETENELGIDGILGQYKVREVTLKRWSSNRSR